MLPFRTQHTYLLLNWANPAVKIPFIQILENQSQPAIFVAFCTALRRRSWDFANPARTKLCTTNNKKNNLSAFHARSDTCIHISQMGLPSISFIHSQEKVFSIFLSNPVSFAIIFLCTYTPSKCYLLAHPPLSPSSSSFSSSSQLSPPPRHAMPTSPGSIPPPAPPTPSYSITTTSSISPRIPTSQTRP